MDEVSDLEKKTIKKIHILDSLHGFIMNVTVKVAIWFLCFYVLDSTTLT